MGYNHDFTGHTERLQATAPVEWRQYEHLLVAHWTAAGEDGGTGRYVSGNPRLSIFFDDMSSVTATAGDETRSLARAIFVPAGMTLRTRFSRSLLFAHLDIHMDRGWASRFLCGALPRAMAMQALERPAERDDISDIEPLARLLVREVRRPRRPDLFAESLAQALVAAVLDLAPAPQPTANARLTAAQMGKVTTRFEAGGGRRLSTAQMAASVNLSESWFTQVFRNTTGLTPHQWQVARRIDLARNLLSGTTLSVAEIADRLGFSDQAHLTRTFARIAGETPASWRRTHR